MRSEDMEVAVIVAGVAFFVVLWLLLFSPVSPLLKMVVDVLTDPLVSMISAVTAMGVAYYVVTALGLSLIV
jgi:uncharacterized membrane-anchored protein